MPSNYSQSLFLNQTSDMLYMSILYSFQGFVQSSWKDCIFKKKTKPKASSNWRLLHPSWVKYCNGHPILGAEQYVSVGRFHLVCRVQFTHNFVAQNQGRRWWNKGLKAPMIALTASVI